MKILLVEDNARLSNLVVGELCNAGFVADWVESLQAADDALAVGVFDLLLLDLGLPDGDGIAWLRKFRLRNCDVPVIVITARGELDDRITGLDNGADDYLVKPFAIGELLARVRAILRRPGLGLNVVLTAGNLEFNTTSRQLRIAGTETSLARRELTLLEFLLPRLGHVVSREALEQTLYSLDTEFTPNALEVLVSRLRRRLVESQADVSIHTVRGIGYLLRLATA
jgi:DNA-binding response OmpR family regulator